MILSDLKKEEIVMKKDFKKDILRIYALIFMIFVFFSSIKCMFDLINKLFIFPDEITLILIIAIHIGSALLIFSGRLKDER